MVSKSQKINTLILVILFALISQSILLSWSKPASAESTPAISWTTTKPVIFSSTPTEIISSNSCNSSYQIKQVMGNNGLNRICMTSGPKLRFGTYSDGNFKSVVSFRLDTKMYPLYGICGGFDSCLYIPTSDTMIAKHSVSYGSGSATAIYRNFSEHITPVTSVHKIQLTPEQYIYLLMVDYYEFDSSTIPDAILGNNNNPWPIGAAGVSSNGNWVAIELGQRGIGLINMQTLETKRVSDISLSPADYNLSMAELAINNDGNHIAAVGYRTSPVIIDVTPDCSEAITDTNMSTPNYPMVHDCKQAQIDTSEFISNFQYALAPRFDDAGGELGFYAVSNHTTHTTNDPKTDIMTNANQIVMRAAGYTKPRLDYLALGDSFSSGEGELDDTNYQDGTNDEYEKCHVSKLSYPFLIKGINLDFMKSVACSGAKTIDIIGNDDASYSGQGNRLKQEIMSNSDITMAQTQAKNLFIPGRIHQQKFVSEYKPKVITVGVGGNDAGFMDKLKACVLPGTCEAAGTALGRAQAGIEINNLFGTLVGTYTALHMSSPSTKIYAIGYPQIISNNDCSSLGLGHLLLNPAERTFMHEGIRYLNQVVEAAAKAAGVKYIDIENSYGNQVLCGTEEPTAANAIRLGDDSNPIYDTLSNLTGNEDFGSDWIKFIGNESFHPNSEGHDLASKAINGIFNDKILDYEYCPNNATICPDPTITHPPEPKSPDYWKLDSNRDYLMPVIAEFVYNTLHPLGSADSIIRDLKFPSGSLQPGSSADVQIHSNPISLGRFQVADDGSLNVSVTLPDNLEDGYHTIHLYGTSYSGEPVDIYQVIEYKKLVTMTATQSQITDTTTNDLIAKNTNTTQNITESKPVSMTSSSESNDSSIYDQLSDTIALTGSQTVQRPIAVDRSPILAPVKGKSADNASIYVVIGAFSVCIAIIAIAIFLANRMRKIIR